MWELHAAHVRLTIDPQGVPILVLDDGDYITDLIAVGLRFVGFEVDTAADGREALAKVSSSRADLIVLDVAGPDSDGCEVLQRLRRDGLDTPVVPLTARDAPANRAKGLHLGNDDYVTESFGLDELLARIDAVFRRAAGRRLASSDLRRRSDDREVRRGGQRIEMSRTEFNVLEFLMMNSGRVVSKQQILEHVWQYDFGSESTVVETYISYLRNKLDGFGPPTIHTCGLRARGE